MISLPQLLNFVVTSLEQCPLFSHVDILSTQTFSSSQFVIKLRAVTTNQTLMLQVRFYNNAHHLDYAYQLIKDNTPVLRWDNKEHFPALTSHPHHFHRSDGQVESSPLTGDPEHDLPLVLDYLLALPAMPPP